MISHFARHRLVKGTLGVLLLAGGCTPDQRNFFAPPGSPPVISLSATSISFDAALGGADPASKTIITRNNGGGNLDSLRVSSVTYAGGQPTGWLAAAASGSPPDITFQPSIAGLAAGQYSATVRLSHPTAGNSPLDVPVTLNIQSLPELGLSTRQIRFAGSPGQGSIAPQLVSLTNTGTGTLGGLSVTGIQYASGQPIGWLTAALSGATAPATLSLTANGGGLPAGDYTANVRISAPGAVVTSEVVVVQLQLQATPIITLSAITQSLSGTAGGTNPAGGTVQVTNGGGGSLTGLSLGTIQYGPGGAGWLSASMAGTAAPTTITTSVNIAGLVAGNYQATIPVSSTDTTIPVVGLTVRLSLTALPTIKFSASAVNFVGLTGSPAPLPQSVLISNGGTGTLSGLSVGTITYPSGTGGWLSASLQGTTAPATLTLTVTNPPQATGLFTANVPVLSSTPGVTAMTLPVTIAVSANAPAGIVGLTGNNQIGVIGTPLSVTMKARVLNSASAPFQGAPVTWTAGQGGSILNATTTSDVNGEVTATWVLGPNTGAQTLSVATPGVTPFTFNATAATLPAGGHPNEPLGMTQLTDRPFNNRVELTWFDRGDFNFSIVPDATAPASLPNVGQARFPLGFAGGSGPIMTNFYPTTQPQHIYLAFWIKLSPNWDGHSSYVNKVFHIWVNGVNRVYLTLTGIDTQNFTPRIALQGVNESPVSRNLSPNTGTTTRINRGQWHFWEIELKVNTPGQANGIAKWWMDGVHLGNYTDINYLAPSPAKDYWENISWNPTWGGGGDIVPADQFMWLDNVYLSGK